MLFEILADAERTPRAGQQDRPYRRVGRRLAEGPTVAYAAIKESLAYGAGHSLVETLSKEDELQERAGRSQDHRIAVEAFLRKESPKYVGR